MFVKFGLIKLLVHYTKGTLQHCNADAPGMTHSSDSPFWGKSSEMGFHSTRSSFTINWLL